MDSVNKPLKRWVRPRFNRYINDSFAFDYFGSERGGHYGFIKWLLGRWGEPIAHITMANSSKPGLLWNHPSGWDTTSEKMWPLATSLGYGPDAPLSTPSRLSIPRRLVLVRDVRNVWASRLEANKKGMTFNVGKDGLERWKEYAKNADVMYDAWVQDPEATLQLINTAWNLALPYDPKDENLRKVVPIAGGSSFTGTTKPASPAVLTRWHAYKDILDQYLDDEALDLNSSLHRRFTNGSLR